MHQPCSSHPNDRAASHSSHYWDRRLACFFMMDLMGGSQCYLNAAFAISNDSSPGPSSPATLISTVFSNFVNPIIPPVHSSTLGLSQLPRPQGPKYFFISPFSLLFCFGNIVAALGFNLQINGFLITRILNSVEETAVGTKAQSNTWKKSAFLERLPARSTPSVFTSGLPRKWSRSTSRRTWPTSSKE